MCEQRVEDAELRSNSVLRYDRSIRSLIYFRDFNQAGRRWRVVDSRQIEHCMGCDRRARDHLVISLAEWKL